MADRPSCTSCVFADPQIGDEGEPFLNCRRFPPSFFAFDPGDGEAVQAWPQVSETDWCGEHEAVG